MGIEGVGETVVVAAQITEEPAPTGLRVAVFWTSYALGIVVMIFSFLLAQVPRPRQGVSFNLDRVCWSPAAALLIICILTAKRIREGYPEGNQTRLGVTHHIVIAAACFQLAFSIYGILSFL